MRTGAFRQKPVRHAWPWYGHFSISTNQSSGSASRNALSSCCRVRPRGTTLRAYRMRASVVVKTRQILALRKSEVVRARVPSALKETFLTGPLCPPSVANSAPEFTSHNRAVGA